MHTIHQFGGNWTQEKLERLKKYLRAYMTIFTANQFARRYTTYYVDAFAGTGARISPENTPASTLSLFTDQDDVKDIKQFYEGSAQIALELDPPFERYIFIENKPQFAQELRNLSARFKDRNVQIVPRDSNEFLQEWCRSMNWERSRAVVFLDPYGMAVDWETIEALAATKAVDLWVLLPVGQAINRMLKRRSILLGTWPDKLTRFFGTEAWKDSFYHTDQLSQPQLSLLPTDDLPMDFEKTATFESIGRFFSERLSTVFEKVAENSLVLLNSKNVPLYQLFFAAANPRGASTAVKIADHILRG
ncbi:MAG: three-Cys-motif partner protein TcmP [Caldilineaceae bacterium]|nr:three-Cys-motif partner protein TcmP [Caldilineaceae bacterium]